MANIAGAPDKPRALAYLRVSTSKQAEEGMSLQAQEERMRGIAEAEGWDLLEVVTDAESGGKRREKLDAIFADLDRFDVLLIDKINRFGRRFSHSVALKEKLDEAGKQLHCREPRMNYSSSSGKLVWGLLSTVAEHEREEIGLRVADTSRQNREAGRVQGGHAPFGYRWTGDGKAGLRIDSNEAPTVKRIFAEYVAGKTANAIAHDLRRDGVLTRNGKNWVPSQIGRLLTKAIYRGAVEFKGLVVCEDGAHEAIIEPELWYRADALRKARQAKSGKGRGRPPRARHLFRKGTLLCGECGYSFYARTYPAGRGVYFCSGREQFGAEFCAQMPVDQATLDSATADYFLTIAHDADATRAQFEEVAGLRLREAEALHSQAEGEVSRLSELSARVDADYDRGALSAEVYEGKRRTIAVDLQAASEQAGRLAERLAEAKADAELGDREAELLSWLADLRAAVAGEIADAAHVDSLRAALSRVFDSFVLRSRRDAFHIRGQEFELSDGYVIEPRLKPIWVEDHPSGRIEVFPGFAKVGLDVPEKIAQPTTCS